MNAHLLQVFNSSLLLFFLDVSAHLQVPFWLTVFFCCRLFWAEQGDSADWSHFHNGFMPFLFQEKLIFIIPFAEFYTKNLLSSFHTHRESGSKFNCIFFSSFFNIPIAFCSFIHIASPFLSLFILIVWWTPSFFPA